MFPKSEFAKDASRSPNARLVNVQHAAQYLAVSVSTLYGWVYQRRIPFVKVGRALRIDVSDLDQFIESNRIRPRTC